jgi:DNA-binding CsgD family transcriptional regulator
VALVPVEWPFVGRTAELDIFTSALRNRSCRGVCVFGAAGAGKTRLAEECLAIAQRVGHEVRRVTATSLAGRVPLGALAHLLSRVDAADEGDVAARFMAVVASVREQAGSRRLVLFVDDLPLLDETSAVLLQRLLDAGDTFLLGTARSAQATTSGPMEAVRGDGVRRVDLEYLDRADFEAMLVRAVGGEVVPATLSSLWSLTLGNPLFAREIVLAAQARGALHVRHGVWHLSGRVPLIGQLGDAIRSRLGEIPAEQRPVTEVVAVAAPVDLLELVERFGKARVEALEQSGVLRIVVDGPHHQVELAHPLYGELICEAMASMTRQRVLADHLAWLDGRSPAGEADAVRRAVWRLEAAGSADPALLLTAARSARYAHDYRNVERLARAALAQKQSSAGQLILGQALADLGRFEEAETTLAQAQTNAVDDGELVRAVMARLRNFVWGLLRPTDAEELARAAYAEARGGAARDMLRAGIGWVLVFSDRPAEALDVLEGLGGDSRRGGELGAIAEACALIARGLPERAAVVARVGRDSRITSSADVDRPGTHLATEVYALVEGGHLEGAFEIGEAGYQVARQQRHPIGQILFTLTLGRGALVAGTPRTAKRWLAESDALCTKFSFEGPRRIVLSALATANSWLGEVDLARQAVAELVDLPSFGFMTPEQERGRAWAAVMGGELNAGCVILAAAVAQGAESGHRNSEALLLHDLVRLGRGADVADRLVELGRLSDAPLLAAYAAHARAAADNDPAALTEAARTFESIGAWLSAAEAFAAAAQAWFRQGERQRAATAQSRAAALTERCEGARTPALSTLVVPVALTKREREIATLAAMGMPSSAIAADLVLSVRTVNNHLQRTYVKLGVTSRGELRAALDIKDAKRL